MTSQTPAPGRKSDAVDGEVGPAAQKRRAPIATLAKAAFSVGLLLWLLHGMDLAKLWATVRGMNVRWFLLALCSFTLDILFRGFKWRLILNARGITMSYPMCLRYYWIGTFWNMFLPSRVGGDVVKMFLVRKAVGDDQRLNTMISVITDRVTSVLGFFVLGSSALLVALPNKLAVLGAAAAAILAGFCGIALMKSRLISRLALRVAPPSGRAGWIAGAVESFESQLSSRKHTVILVCLGTLVQLIVVLNTMLVGRALGVSLTFVQYVWSICVVGLITLLPVTLNGLGLREGVFVSVTGAWGLPAEQAFAVSLLTFLVALIVSLPGGLLYWGEGSPLRDGHGA